MTEAEAQELARKCAAAMYERDEAAREMGIAIEHVAPGEAVLSMAVRTDMINGHAICHGGYIFALADTAFAYACNSRDAVTVAQSCSIEYLSPVREGERLTAQARELHRSARSGIYDVMVEREDGTAVAHFRGRARQIEGRVLQ